MQSTSPRLLIVDDDPSDIRVLSGILAHYPELEFATSGSEALARVAAGRPDLILLDAAMPGMSGFDLCRALRRDPALADVPVIFATSHGGPAFELEALEAGASDFVTKPLQPEQVRARVRSQLRAVPPVAEGTDAPTVIAARQRPVILLVDDDAGALTVLQSLLAPMAETHQALSGGEVLALMETVQPDLVLLDARMPGLSGFEVCATLKSLNRWRHVPVIFVTQYKDAIAEVRALELGAADFISKPLNAPVVRARVRNVLEIKQRNDQALVAAKAEWRMLGDARVAEVVRSVGDGIVTVNARGRVVLANPAACALFGRPDTLVVGRALHELIGIDVLDPALSGPSPPPAIDLPGTDGGRLELSVSRVDSGDDALTTVILRDVTARERLRSESELRLRLEERNRSRATMMSAVAHEIGNPLNGILGLGQLLQADVRDPQDSELARRLALLMECGQQIRRLLQDVSSLGQAEVEVCRVTDEAVALRGVIRAAGAAVAAPAELAGIALTLPAMDEDVFVRADGERTRQVLINLLSNAIKYNRPAGSVRVTLATDDRWVVVEVGDDGIGMNDSQLAQLFQPFNRLGQERSALPGSGLGMAIARQFVLAMGGTLEVRSKPREGTQISLRLRRHLAGLAGLAGPAG